MKNSDVNNRCVLTYKLPDTDIINLSEEEQDAYVEMYQRFLDSLPEDTYVCISSVRFEKAPQKLFEKQKDGFYELCEEYEQNYADSSHLCREQYLTLSVDTRKKTETELNQWQYNICLSISLLNINSVFKEKILPANEDIETFFKDYGYHKTLVDPMLLRTQAKIGEGISISDDPRFGQDSIVSIHLTPVKNKGGKTHAHRLERGYKVACTLTRFVKDKQEFKDTPYVFFPTCIPEKCKSTDKLGFDVLTGKVPLEAGNTVSAGKAAFGAACMCSRSVEIIEQNGLYYGRNISTYNPILCDRDALYSPHGIIAGTAGSGKGFVAKNEIVQRFLRGERITILDPERDYSQMTERLGGTVLRFEPKSGLYINPCDLVYEELDASPLVEKCDFMIAFVEAAMGRSRECDADERSAIHRATKKMYEDYICMMEERRKNGSKETIDRSICPTLADFYTCLLSDGSSAGQSLAGIIKPFLEEYNCFARRTNIDTDAQIVNYDLQDFPEKIKEAAILTCMSDIYSRREPSKKTNHVYMEGINTLLDKEESASWMRYFFARARLLNISLTCITQDLSDFMQSGYGRNILNNIPFLILMNQLPEVREMLKKQYELSDTQLEYIKNSDCGTGLILVRSDVIPFKNVRVSYNSKLYETFAARS